jgi:two-component system, cell cycle response regulator DivK
MAEADILMVDDHPGNLKLLSFILEKLGYGVRLARDAEQALAILKEARPRLILMDLQLPGMDGLELTRRLKADPAYRDIPIVAVTASAMKGDERKAAAAGCDGYVTKPIDTRLVPGLVAQYLGPRPNQE